MMLLASPVTSSSYHRVIFSSYRSFRNLRLPSVSGNMQAHAFARNPFRANTHDAVDSSSLNSAVSALSSALNCRNQDALRDFKVLLFNKGKPLARSELGTSENACPLWKIGWRSLSDCKNLTGRCEVQLIEDSLVYLGKKGGVIYWAMDVTDIENSSFEPAQQDRAAYVELRTLMVATDWADANAMGELAIAGHAKALLEWHNTSRFCGHCGTRNRPIDAGRRKQCSNELCKKRVYPRVDPVVIMLVIDKENDCALLSRQSRYVSRMWSCLAGFLEPGESLEEAVRRETFEETGIEVGDVIYHSSQPWPVGPSSMPCQLMVGFFANANSSEIHVDKEELEGTPMLISALQLLGTTIIWRISSCKQISVMAFHGRLRILKLSPSPAVSLYDAFDCQNVFFMVHVLHCLGDKYILLLLCKACETYLYTDIYFECTTDRIYDMFYPLMENETRD